MRPLSAMRGQRRSAAPLAGAVLIAACTMLAAACTTSTTSTPAAASRPVTPPTAAASADPCSLPTANQPEPIASPVVLGVISISSAEDFSTVRVDQDGWSYWQKYPLGIQAGSQAVTITVPTAWQTQVAFTWGQNTGITSTLRLPGCQAAPGTWNVYVGGFYLRSSSACVPLQFNVGSRSTVVKVGVGRRC